MYCRHPGFWLLGLAYSIPTGAFGVWGSVLNINLSPVGVSQVGTPLYWELYDRHLCAKL